MHYVLLGNCQLQALRDIFRRFIGRHEPAIFDFVNAYEGVTPDSHAVLRRADVVVLQQGPRAAVIDRQHIPPGVPVHLVPSVNGTFLWPFQGIRHPLKPVERYGNPPYPEDYNDQFLAKLIVQNVAPEKALQMYRDFDVAGHTRVQRIYVHTLRTQRALDCLCGFDTAGIIEGFLQEEQLFQAPYHFSGRLARHLTATLSRRMGFPETYARRIETYLTDAPFLARFLPVHPSIAAHFGLRWVSPETRYPFLYEGGFTFDEYVVRFMTATWSAALQEGVIDAQRFEPHAKAKLIQGLQEAPRSAIGHHMLAGILEREGDIGAALAHQRQAFALEKDFNIATRLGNLLLRSGDRPGAIDAFAEAARLDPTNPPAWSKLRDVLLSAHRYEEADLANARFREFSQKLSSHGHAAAQQQSV
jgi:tetratricopeptide (TPR) repeat protein